MKPITAVLITLAVACGGSEKSAEEPTNPDDRVEVGDRDGARSSSTPELDDDEDDSFDVQGLRGHLAAGEADRVFRANSSKLLGCFSKHSKRSGWLGGDIKLFFVVTPDGAVKQVHAESDVGSWPVEACVLGVARAMTFKPPRGGEAEFEQSVNFPSRRSTLPWDEDKTDQEVAEKLPELEACENPPPDIWVTLYVGTRGKVLSTGFSSGTKSPIDETWATCAADIISKWTLSDPRGVIAKAFFRYAP